MRVLVTGGTGSVGRRTVARLTTKGHAVRVIGRRPDMEIPDAEYAVCDINEADGVREQAQGCDAIVHLAAVPSPRRDRPQDVLQVNVTGTFNVFLAAAAHGIRRVVQASSINALGAKFGVRPLPVEYFPVDEDHPTLPTDEYSLSKNFIEDLGRYFWLREGISSVALRFPWVYNVEADYFAEHRDRLLALQPQIRRALDGPEAARQALFQQVCQRLNRMHTHYNRGLHRHRRRRQRPPEGDPVVRYFAHALPDFCTVVDARDAAQAIERGLVADYEGAHVLFVNERENTAGADAEQIAQTFFPNVTARRRPLVGPDSLISIDRARALLGFEPEHSFV